MADSSNLHGRALTRGVRTSRGLLQIASHISAAIGIQFFQSMVQQLAKVLAADCVYIGEFAGGQSERVRTLAASGHGDSDSALEFALAGSAAVEIALGRPFLCRKGVRQKFPDDEMLSELQAEAFVAVPLLHPTQGPLGILAAVYREPVSSLRGSKSMLDVFAPRAAAELVRKQADELLRESEQRHLAFISANPDGMWRVEFERPIPTDLPDETQVDLILRSGYIAECNDALARFVGRSKAVQVVGSAISTLHELDSDPSMQAAVLALVNSRYRLTTVETRPRGPNGIRRYMLRSQWGIVENGLLQRIWGTSRDITQLRKSELALDASEQRMADLLEAMHLVVVMLDSSGGIAFCNDQLLKMTGWTLAEAKGKNWLELMVPVDDQSAMRGALSSLKNGPSGPVHLESALLGRDGRRWWIAWDCSLLSDAGGSNTAIVNVGRDITEYRELEAQFRQAQKLESIGRLASGVAHDFNNLLTVIIGYSDALIAAGGLKESADIGLREIKKAASKGADLAHQLLAFSSRQTLRPTLIDLNILVADSERMLRRLIGDDVELTTRLETGVGLIRADAGHIHQVLLNLAVNARDAMPHGGKLIISSHNLNINGAKVNHINAAPGRYVELNVSDTGAGMTPDVLERLFEPFFTTKPPGRGTGLGLSTVYGIVQQSGGHISVESQPNHGSVFSIIFPRVDPAADDSAAAAERQLIGGTEAILLVEDQSEVRILTASILRELGYTVREVDGPAAALDLLQNSDLSFDLVLTDIVMPAMGGIELSDLIRQTRRDVKVLFMSGYADRSVFEDKPEARQAPYIQKPFTREGLGLKVREVLDRL